MSEARTPALALAQWLSRQVAPAWSPREPAPLHRGQGTPPMAPPDGPEPRYLRGWPFAGSVSAPAGAQWIGPLDAAQPNCVAAGQDRKSVV